MRPAACRGPRPAHRAAPSPAPSAPAPTGLRRSVPGLQSGFVNPITHLDPGLPVPAPVATGQAGTARARRRLADTLAAYQRFLRAPVVDIEDPAELTVAEHRALSARLAAANMVVYRLRRPASARRDDLLRLAAQFGLHTPGRNPCADADGFSEICNRPGRPSRYRPYTDAALNWHTDGCYDPDSRGIGAFLLHCLRPASSGGGNRFIDHRVLVQQLRADSSVTVDALFDADGFVVPANVVDGIELRPAVRGAVLAMRNGRLHMRYSSRQRNLRFKDDPAFSAALGALRERLRQPSLALAIRLEAGMGVLAANVLHCRDAFVDRGPGRLLLRARFHDDIAPEALTASADDLA